MEFVYFCVIEFKTMAYDKTIYIEQQLTKYLRDYFDGKITQEDIDWVESIGLVTV